MSNSTGLPPIPAGIANTTAPLIFGTLFNWALYGVLSVQTYVYYLNFPEDSSWKKALDLSTVYGCYIFEMIQTAMTAADLYFWFGSGYGNLTRLGNVNISPADTPILCGIIAAVVQCFFAYRIFTLRRSYWSICVLIILISIMQAAGAFGAGIRGFKLQEYARFHENTMFPASFDVWLIGSALCDVLIAGTMLWLFRQTKREGTRNGRRILGKLVCLILETNTFTAGIALLSFIFYTTLPDSNLFISIGLIMGKLYSNTLLVTFNNRIALRHVDAEPSFDSKGRNVAANRLSSQRPILNPELSTMTFCVAPDSFNQKSMGLESYEIEYLPPPRTSPPPENPASPLRMLATSRSPLPAQGPTRSPPHPGWAMPPLFPSGASCYTVRSFATYDPVRSLLPSVAVCPWTFFLVATRSVARPSGRQRTVYPLL
ncbi:hypothetical protein HYPSUDRAFT_208133 [Hypholoma sublateritium FD-334 SS-4]|uniref:DUF6534 domain-containing protein n=1 Tax=Hypholoma sublateritium (strain FD-334 SS-4) TaxID=945553 RepID=A0A0D2P3Q6_HYPSF|nr:hypothetical protein HYPSUDRAFT_208133 [Hypholoma sublateritium FD-334 SS-4]